MTRTFGFFECTKLFRSPQGEKVVLREAELSFGQYDRVAVLVQGGAGKTTLVRMLAGLDEHFTGEVRRPEGASWPIGFSGAFHPALSGEENVRTLAALCLVDPDEMAAYVSLFCELGDDFSAPVSTYSAGMRARLGVSFSLAVPAQFYLADEVVGMGDDAFRMKCEVALKRRLDQAGLFLATRNPRTAERFCDRFIVLRDGALIACASLKEAQALHERPSYSEMSEINSVLDGFQRA